MSVSPADAICQFVPPFVRFLRQGLVDLNISPARFQLLQVLHQAGTLTMVELADRLSVTKRNVTSLVDGLEKEGFATRHSHPTDRRATLVELTKSGDALFGKAAELQREHLQSLIVNLDPKQQKVMTEALLILTRELAEQNPSKLSQEE